MSETKKILTIIGEYSNSKIFRKFHSREDLDSYHTRKLDKLLKFVFNKSPYYRERLQAPNIDQFKKLETIDKKIMIENFDRLNTAGIKKEEAYELAIEGERTRNFSPTIKNVTVGLSSGTSGHRGIFLANPKEQAKYAGVVLAKLLPRSLFANHKIGYFLRSDSNLYQSGKNKNIQFAYFDMIQPIEENVAKLNEFQPTTLLAPPSILRKLAYRKEVGELKIEPEKVISIAEVLDPLDERYISKAFKQIVHQVYQCTEGFLGATCEHGTMHLNEDLVYFEKEYIDKEKTKFMPIVTDLTRTTQPYLRYKLNDVLVERQTPCPCGSPFTAVKAIEGRCDDIFYFPKNETNELVTVFSDFIRRIILFADDSIKEYQVKQHSFDEVEVKLDEESFSSEKTRERVVTEFKNLAEELGFQVPNINFSHEFENLGLNKLRRIQRTFKIEDKHI